LGILDFWLSNVLYLQKYWSNSLSWKYVPIWIWILKLMIMWNEEKPLAAWSKFSGPKCFSLFWQETEHFFFWGGGPYLILLFIQNSNEQCMVYRASNIRACPNTSCIYKPWLANPKRLCEWVVDKYQIISCSSNSILFRGYVWGTIFVSFSWNLPLIVFILKSVLPYMEINISTKGWVY